MFNVLAKGMLQNLKTKSNVHLFFKDFYEYIKIPANS
jgi:hypothetical protein